MTILTEINTGAIAGYGALAIMLFSVFFEISPIKFNPISMFLGWLGKKMTGGIEKKVDTIDENLKKVETKVDDNEIDRIRYEILDFANGCRNKRKHTKDEFTHIIAINQKYHAILESRGAVNGQVDVEYEMIVDIYKECLENNSFL